MELFEEALMYLQNENVAVGPAGSDLLEEVFTDDSFDQSPLETGPFTLPDVGTKSTSEYLLEKRLVVLRGILNSEQLYLNELETLLMPMKALKATAGTSQPVLSCQDIQTVFFQVPELLALHRDFYQSLKARLEGATELGEGLRNEQRQGACRSLSAEQGLGNEQRQGACRSLSAEQGLGNEQRQGACRSLSTEQGLGNKQRQGVCRSLSIEHGLGNEQRQGACRGLSTEQDLVVEQCKDHYKLSVGDLFQKLVSQLATYRGFIDNYESAVEIVRSCTQTDERFRILAESMKSGKGSDNSQSEYTFEALLYKPLDRVTKTTLVLHDLLSHTPPDHHDNPLLQEALRISSSFLAGLNETSQCKRAVTLSKGMRRQLMHDGFVVCVCENGRSLRHLFLYTDLLLCAKLKTGTLGRHSQYRYCWYTPLFGLKVRWAGEQEHPPELQQRISCMKAKMYHLRQTLTQQTKKGCHSRFVDRIHRKLQECELWLLTHSPNLPLQLHSTSGKSHTLLMSSLYKLEEWREAMDRLIGENTETVPPDLLTLTNSCVKLRMTQQPHLESLQPPESAELSLCGTLSVVVHSATGLQQPACVCVHVEVDGFEFYSNKAQTHSSFNSLEPQWNQEISFQVDGAKSLRIVCVIQSENSEEDRVVGHGSLKLDPAITKKWKKLNLPMGQLDLTLSIKYLPHPLDPPSSTFTQQLPVFCVPIEVVSQLEGVLVPRVVRSCAEEVERRGLEEEGMYRTSGSAKEIQLLKHTFDTNLREAVKCVKTAEVNVVSGTLKLYFRDLPEPLVPADLYHSLKNALDLPDLTSKQNALLNILRSCPDVNRNTLLYLFHHLRKVAGRVEVNKMSVMNLATVFGPSLLRPPVARVDISEEVVVQDMPYVVLCSGLEYPAKMEEKLSRHDIASYAAKMTPVQVVYFYLKCENLPTPLTCLPFDTEDEQETIM